MMLVLYNTRAELERAVGGELKYYDDPRTPDDDWTPDGEIQVHSLPGRFAFTAKVTMKGGLVESVDFGG
jgi:hypothetical protein